jgi:hypothetical protein
MEDLVAVARLDTPEELMTAFPDAQVVAGDVIVAVDGISTVIGRMGAKLELNEAGRILAAKLPSEAPVTRRTRREKTA